MPYSRQVLKSWTCAETGNKRILVEISEGGMVARREHLCAGATIMAADLALAYAMLEVEAEAGEPGASLPESDELGGLPVPTEQEIADAKAAL